MVEEEVKKETAEEPKVADDSDQVAEGEAAKTAEESTGKPAEEPKAKSEANPDEKPAEEKTEASAEPDWKLQYARLLADFDNYKKRAARDRDDTYRYVESQVLRDLLPSVDNLAMAYEQAENKEDPFVKGVKLVYDGILAMMKEHEAEPFDSIGLELDTEKMEAIAHLPSSDVEAGKVSIESKKGWMLKGKVLRVAQVVISSGKPQ